jgi:hypothetical protein
MTTTRNHSTETVTAIRAAKDALTMARIDAYATGEEVGAELDFAIRNLESVLTRIATGNTGAPVAINR